MRVDRISINDSRIRVQYGEGSEGLKAIPLFIDTDNEIQVVAHRVMDGPHQGSILTPDKYVVLGSNKSFSMCDEDLVKNVNTLIHVWESKEILTGTPEEDRIEFAKELVNYFKSKL